MQTSPASPVCFSPEVSGQGKVAAKLPILLALFLFTANVCLLSLPLSARAGETLQLNDKSGSTSAALTFAIVIPSVLRILEDTHPDILQVYGAFDTLVSAQQRMVVISTLGKGFCMDLRLASQQVVSWHMTSSGSSAGIWIETTVGGYRLCARKAGRFEIYLQHNFELTQKASPTPLNGTSWPVNVSLTNP